MARGVTIPLHTYDSDPQSGAGNCWCGWAEEAVVHPHSFRPSYIDPLKCVCRRPPNHRVHTSDVGDSQGTHQ